MKQFLPFPLLLCFFFSPTWAAPHFIENKGQIQNQHGAFRSDIDFVLRERSFQLFIGKGVLIWQFQKSEQEDKVVYNRMEARLLDFNPSAILLREKPLLTQYHYYLPGCGQDGAHAQSFDKITYQNIYPGIDWEIYINQSGKVEYDFVLHAGADLNQIKMEIKGAEKVTLPGDGSLMAACALGEVRQALPLAFDSKGNSIACNYVLEENILRFNAAAPKGEKWRIDPELEWGTYFGGTEDEGWFEGITIYPGNQPLMYGLTQSANNIATEGAYQDTIGNSISAFMALFNPAGALVWGTYFSGNQPDRIHDLVTDDAGNLFVTGTSRSAGLATPGVFQTTKPFPIDGPFLARFNSSGHRIWFTYFGDGGHGYSIALSPDSTLYITGAILDSLPFYGPMPHIATEGAHQEAFGGFVTDAYLAKFDLHGNRIWSTYYGGELGDVGTSVYTDEQSNVYLTGSSNSSNAIATPGSFQPAISGANDVFVAKFTEAGQRVWGSYFGGTGDDNRPVLIARESRLYLLSNTGSVGMATPGAHQESLGGPSDFLLSAWDTSGQRLWSTYYGGESNEGSLLTSKRLNFLEGDLLISGNTNSSAGIATPGAYMTVLPNSLNSGVMARFSPGGALLWGSYLGGNINDEHFIAVPGDSGVIYAGGRTQSTTGIATSGAWQETNQSGLMGFDAFLIKLKDEQPEDTSVGITPVVLLHGKATFTLSPNPVQHTAALHGMAPESAFPLQVSCTDATGKTLWQQTISRQADLPRTLDFSRQPAGVYLLHIKGKGVGQSLKVVRE